MPERTIQNAVIGAIASSSLPPPAKVLDLSCGDGDILQQLAEQGYAVEGTHYKEDDYIIRQKSPILETIPLHSEVDLSQPLPFPDASFDIVLATEVLEHLPSHSIILKEIGRILKKGGLLVFTTPNIHRLSSRFQFLVTGTHAMCGARLGWHVPKDELYSTHFNPVYFPVAHSILQQNELKMTSLGLTKVQFWDYVLFPFLYLFILVGSVVEAFHFMKRSKAGGRDLLKWMLNYRYLLSKQLVVVATKE